MSRPQPRSVYVRRRLLVLAVVLLAAWLVVQFWPGRHKPATPVATPTATAPATPTAPASPPPTIPPGDALINVAVRGGGGKCNPRKVTISPSVPSPQNIRRPVVIDVAVTTTAKKPCMITPKAYDPLAVIGGGSGAVWDSSVCKKAVVPQPIQLSPGWATTIRALWIPRKSGKDCSSDEHWVGEGKYTLRVGMLGGEPGKSSFTLVKPPPTPKPTSSPTPVKPTAGKPTPAQPTQPATSPHASPKPAG